VLARARELVELGRRHGYAPDEVVELVTAVAYRSAR